MPSPDPQMLKGVLPLLLLRSLSERDDYGYSIVERLRNAGLADIAEGTVYPALSRLEKQGLVETFYVPSDKGPARKYYRSTTNGQEHLAEGIRAWVELDRLLQTESI